MNIVVTVKQVPDTTKIEIDKETGTLKREGLPSIMNPEDKNALESALRIKDHNKSDVFVIAVSMGPKQAVEVLKEAISLGADAAYLLSDSEFAGSDTRATAYILAKGIKYAQKQHGKIDLIICGHQAIDGDTAQTGPQIAEELGLPNISYVEEFVEISKEKIRVRSRFDNKIYDLSSEYPVLLTVTKYVNTPRYPSVKGMLRLRKIKPVILSSKELQTNRLYTGLSGSPTRVHKTFEPELKKNGKTVSEEEAVSEFLFFLKENLNR